MTDHAQIGHNNPPCSIDIALAPFGDAIEEAENWLDGEPVSTDDQMKAVDALIAEVRKAKIAVEKARKDATQPLHDAWKAEVERWKPTESDLTLRLKGLVALVSGLKKDKEKQRAEKARVAFEEADRKRREAEAASQQADPSNYEATRNAAALAQEAMDAEKTAKAIHQCKEKGMRTVTKWEVVNHKDALRWINKHAQDALVSFIEEYVRKHHKGQEIDGVTVRQEKEAY